MPGRRTLCLDLDDTLTLMTFERVKDPFTGELRQYDTIVTAQDNPEDWGMVYFRPFLRTFLEAVSQSFEVVLFTAACKEYADQILNAIDPDNRLFHYRLYRDSCDECTPNPSHPDAKIYIKDLRVLGRNLEDVILVDNSLLCFAYQLDNGIVCNPFKGDPADRELIAILEVLTMINRSPGADVKRFFRKMYGLPDVIQEYSDRGGRRGIKQGRHSVLDEFLDTPTQAKKFDLEDVGSNNMLSQKSTAMNTPTSKDTREEMITKQPDPLASYTRYESVGPVIQEAHYPESTRNTPVIAAPPIFINTILPGLEPTRTPIQTLYTSLIKHQTRQRFF
jgi:Dullard-like phosphatase family protein